MNHYVLLIYTCNMYLLMNKFANIKLNYYLCANNTKTIYELLRYVESLMFKYGRNLAP